MTDKATISTIPTPLTPLIGRDEELAQVMALLTGDARLLTITGIGGIGKTRLATQVALELEPHFANGAVMVPLAEHRDQTAILPEIAKALGQSVPGIDLRSLVNLLGAGERLLVLDNLEQIPAVSDTIAELVTSHAGLTILCTSQVSLDVPGEHVYPLQPMTTAAIDASITDIRKSPSVALFCYRAHTANAQRVFDPNDIRMIVEICATLDGIPLAIELAAARTSILTLPELRDRLINRFDVLSGGSRQLPDRLRTMRNAIGWSYGLLNPDERRIFRHLGVYAGKLHIEAIEHTLSSLGNTSSPLDTIDFFVSRSLLRQVPGGGFQMLESLRAFAQEQLETEGDAFAARLSHTKYIVQLAETAEPHLQGTDQAKWFTRLTSELTNIHTACEWAATNQPELMLRILTGTWRFLETQGLAQEFTRLGQLATTVVSDPTLRAPALVGIGYLHEGVRELNQAEVSFTQALEAAQLCQDWESEYRATLGLGLVAMNRSHMDTARTYLQQSLEIATSNQFIQGQIAALGNLAGLSFHLGNLADAETNYLEVIELLEHSENKNTLSSVFSNLSLITTARGNARLGREYAMRALEIDRDLKNLKNIAYSLSSAAGANYELGEFEKAKDLYEESIQVAKSANMNWLALETSVHLAEVLHQMNDDDAAILHVTPILATMTSDELVRASIDAASVIADIAQARGEHEAATTLIGGVLQLRNEYGSPATPAIALREHTLRDSVPAQMNHPQRIAFDSAQSWDASRLQQEALLLVQQLHLGAEEPSAVQPAPLSSAFNLSPREREVLKMVAQGHSNGEISEAMFISMRTTTTHLTNIFTKLNVKNRMAAVIVAQESNLLTEA